MFALIGDTGSPAEWAATIVACVGAVTTAVVSIINAVRTKDVQKQVSTGNGKTIGEAVKETHDVVVPPSDVIGETPQPSFSERTPQHPGERPARPRNVASPR